MTADDVERVTLNVVRQFTSSNTLDADDLAQISRVACIEGLLHHPEAPYYYFSVCAYHATLRAIGRERRHWLARARHSQRALEALESPVSLEDQAELRRRLLRLPQREWMLLSGWLAGYTLRELGVAAHLTASGVRQILLRVRRSLVS